MLKLENIVKDYVMGDNTVHALRGVSLEFRKSEFVAILGPSGCGKTTMLNIIGGLDRYTSGDLIIDGRSTKDFKDRDWDTYRNHSVGFVFQSYNLIPHQTVLGNVELSLTIAGISKAERTERAKIALDKVGLGDQYKKRPNQMSGGQMQRVAIARALVNDPEIILADEPTGALDTETSKQVMNLLREIAKDRLVIMVTHNDEIANEYANRIIRLRDGEVIKDTNPYGGKISEPVTKKTKKQIAAETTAEQELATKRRAKMSFFTAFRLSLQNLISKKKRSIMVSFAGSIGIIGVALVLAFSFGIQGFITNMQRDMLSGNPITIERSTIDMTAVMTGSFGLGDKAEMTYDLLTGKANVQHMVKRMTEMLEGARNIYVQNTITPDYLSFLQDMPDELLAALFFDYGLDLSNNLYTTFRDNDGVVRDANGTLVNSVEDKAISNPRNISLITIVNIYSTLLRETNLQNYASLVSAIAPSFQQLPENADDYILNQYDLLNGRMPQNKNEIVLVLGQDRLITDLMLAQLGYYSQQEFLNVILRITEGDNYASHSQFNTENLLNKDVRQHIGYDELMGKEFVWHKNDDVFVENATPIPPFGLVPPFTYNESANAQWQVNGANGLPLNIVGILQPNEKTSFGMLQAGIYYTTDLARHIITENFESKLAKYLASRQGGEMTNSVVYFEEGYDMQDILKVPFITPAGGLTLRDGITFEFDYAWQNATKSAYGTVGSMNMMSMLRSVFSNISAESNGSSSSTDPQMIPLATGMLNWQQVGGNSVKDIDGNQVHIPNMIAVYPATLEQKPEVLKYLAIWNSDDNITISLANGGTRVIKAFLQDSNGNYIDEGGNIVDAADRVRIREKITLSDPLSMIFNLVSQMVDLITVALVAFTSLALVVSCVMIGIITYVSVVERIKEIGVIRSLGGRKRDVSNLFTAETFIIGLTSGVFGIVITYLLSWIISAIVNSLAGIAAIAVLPIGTAAIMITLSVGLTLISGLMPSRSAAKKDPVIALRTE